MSAPDQPTHIDYILSDYFAEKSGRGIYYCSACNMQGNKIKNTYCLNLPNYLILEFEDNSKINYLYDLGYKNTTISRHISALKSFFKYLKRNKNKKNKLKFYQMKNFRFRR